MRCINGKDSIIINPIIDWTDADVWDFLNKVMEVPHCELYDPPYNRHRIGCILCPMSSYKTKLRDIELYPYAKREWLKVFEYFIGGGTPQNTEQVLRNRGGQLTDPTRQLPSRKWRYNYSPTPIVRGESKATLPPHHKEERETESPDGPG